MSAIVCVRNHGKFIAQAVESIAREPVDELVVVDDCSGDDSMRIAVAVWLRDGKRPLRTQRLRNPMGVGTARNRALEMASGEHIAMCDADDYWLDGKIRKQQALLGERQDAVVLTLVEQFLDGVPCPPIMRPESIGVPIRLPFPSNLYCHRKVFERVGGFDPELVSANDVDWFRRAFLGVIERLEVPEVLVRKRIHGHNLSLHQGHDMVQQLMRVVSKKV